MNTKDLNKTIKSILKDVKHGYYRFFLKEILYFTIKKNHIEDSVENIAGMVEELLLSHGYEVDVDFFNDDDIDTIGFLIDCEDEIDNIYLIASDIHRVFTKLGVTVNFV